MRPNIIDLTHIDKMMKSFTIMGDVIAVFESCNAASNYARVAMVDSIIGAIYDVVYLDDHTSVVVAQGVERHHDASYYEDKFFFTSYTY